MVGAGARGMLGVGFGLAPDDPGYLGAARRVPAPLRGAHDARDPRLRRRRRRCSARSTAAGIAWGIVTNKATRFTAPLVAALGLFAEAAGTLVCGDTTPHAKPHPAPLLEAARRLGVAPADCVYVGDDERDIEAGRAAGMRTVVAA